MPAGARSNAGRIAAQLEALVRTIDFTRPGREGSLAKDIAAEVAALIHERTVGDQVDATGEDLAPNRGKYGERKEKKGLPVGVGLRSKSSNDSGRMLSLQQIQGRLEITPTRITLRYGTDDDARRKAGWFTVGAEGGGGVEPSGAEGQPPRPFYALDDPMRERVREQCIEFVRELIRRANG